jgi:hypothetical protein
LRTLEVAARVVSVVAIVGKANTGASICSVTGVDALLECGDVVLLDNVVSLIVQITCDLVVFSGSIVKGGAVY